RKVIFTFTADMSSASSAVTYTSVYTDSEPGRVCWGANEELSDEDYIPGPEEPQTPPAPQDEDEHEPMFIQPHDPDFMPEPIYPELLAMPTPSPSPLASLSPPSVGECVARCMAPTALPSLPLPPPLHKPPPVDRRDDIPETEMPPRKRLCLSTLGSRYEVKESSTARSTEGQGIDYGFVSTLDAEARRRGVGEVRVTELAELHEHDAYNLYSLLEDAQDSRTHISQRVTVDLQRVDLLIKDMIAHQETIQIVKDEAYATREAWAHSIGLSQAALGTDGRDSSSDGRHETRDGRHAGRASSTAQIMELVTRQGPSTLPNNTNPNNITPESVHAMIDQALMQNSTNGDGSHGSHEDNRRNVQTARPCFYADFMKYQPLNFKGTEGVVGLTRWIKMMELIFQISDCVIENQGEIKKLEIELWNLKVKKNNVSAYTKRFQELTQICTKFVADETEKIDKYVSGLPDNIYGIVKASKPKTLDETIELANELMDQKLCTYSSRVRKLKSTWQKDFQIFLAHISAKKEEDMMEGKQLEDVPVVRDYPEVFPKDFPGLPPAQPVEFQTDLILGAAPVARAPYQLAPSEMKELSEQLQELSKKGFIRPSFSP
nr:putative reverse transcriptase domain-containing protein [Tanacetum cinerariifolium]